MTLDNKMLYVHHDRTSVTNTQTIFQKGLINSTWLLETKLLPQDKTFI